MKNVRKLGTGSLALAAALLGLPSASYATSCPASHGTVVHPSHAACIQDYESTVTNVCNYNVPYQISLQMDSDGAGIGDWPITTEPIPGGWPVEVTVSGSTTNPSVSSIRVYTINRELTQIDAGSTASFVGTRQIRTVTTNGMPTNGYLYLWIMLAPGDKIEGVNYGFVPRDPLNIPS